MGLVYLTYMNAGSFGGFSCREMYRSSHGYVMGEGIFGEHVQPTAGSFHTQVPPILLLRHRCLLLRVKMRKVGVVEGNMWEFFLKDGTKRLGDGWNNECSNHSWPR